MSARRILRGIGANAAGKSLRFSSIANLLSYAAVVILSLLTFRLMIHTTSAKIVGVWALIVGLVSVARVADLGIGTNITRFVAGLTAPSRKTVRAILMSVALLCVGPVVVLATLLAGPIYVFAAGRADHVATHTDIAWMIAAAAGAGVLATIGGLVSSILEGGGRVIVGSAGNVLYNAVALLSVIPCVRIAGSPGIGLANLIGVGAQTAMFVVLLLQRYKALPTSTSSDRTVRALFDALRTSTLQNFGVVIARMALDPLTRLLVARTAALDVVAYFELALRVASQARAAVQAALQPLLYLGASDQARLAERFQAPHRIVMTLGGAGLVGMAAGAPILSYVVLGQVLPDFLTLLLILATGSMGNLIGAVGYISDASQGRFGNLLRLTLIMVAVNAVVGGFLAMTLGAYGAVVGYALAFVVGGICQLRAFARMSEISLSGDLRAGVGYVCLAVATTVLFLVMGRWAGRSALTTIPLLSIILSGLCGIYGVVELRRISRRTSDGTVSRC